MAYSGDLNAEMDLGEGTSSGNSYMNGSTSKAFTISSLKQMSWMPATKFQQDEIPYIAINIKVPPPISKMNGKEPAVLVSAMKTPVTIPTPTPKGPPLFPLIDPAVSWPGNPNVGKGLENLGNTCFLNSAMQVLLHTAPLVRYVLSDKHDEKNCAMMKTAKKFCMTCVMKGVMRMTYKSDGGRSFSPRIVTNNIRKIASQMRIGRQEDSHEFLRFCIDAMQLSCLAGRKLPIETKESTFVHQIFGGRLRSRVTCKVCKHPSDTFDSMLDLSLDINRADSIKDALGTFVKIDILKGANKYKCEKCKKLVEAEKNFTIHEAPMILTIHFKRFTPSGKKLTDAIKYPEHLNLAPYMSDRATSPNYRLFGVINHLGGGPHSGHYTANVKSASGKWHYMNDESVTSTTAAPLNAKSAYVLFYCREQGDALNSIISGPPRIGHGVTSSASAMASPPVTLSKRAAKRARASLEGLPPNKKPNTGSPISTPIPARFPPQPISPVRSTPISPTSQSNPFNGTASPNSTTAFSSSNPFHQAVTGAVKGSPITPSVGLYQSKVRNGNGKGNGKIAITKVGALRANGPPRVIRA